MHPAGIKPLADLLPGPIRRLCKATPRQGYFLQNWKTATVVAISKGVSRSDIRDYSTANLASVPHEVLERTIKEYAPTSDSAHHAVLRSMWVSETEIPPYMSIVLLRQSTPKTR